MENWFAAYTRPHHEKTVAVSLDRRGFETLYPSYRVASRWKDRVKQIELPLFPGYVFVRCVPARRLPVLQTPGLLHLVHDDAGPIAVPEFEITNLRLALSDRARIEPAPFLNVGERVRVHSGVMAGLEGILVAKKNSLRVIISVEMLAGSAAVELDGALLERASVPGLASTRARTAHAGA